MADCYKKPLPSLRVSIPKRGKGARSELGRLLLGSRSPVLTRVGYRSAGAGFTLIELMIVIAIILILLSIAAPIYRSSIIRAREAVLRDHLFTMRSLLDQYTLDKQQAPQSLEDLVMEGYLREIPVDPFTRSRDTWVVVYEDNVLMNPAQISPGIVDLHSGSNQTGLDGSNYSSW